MRSVLPPKPVGAAAFVPLTRLSRFPEVYADAQVSTDGIVKRLGPHAFALTAAGVHTRIALDPANVAAPLAGRRVSASGTFTVSFQAGYELLLGRIAARGRL
jgi:hypothetical protein